MKKWHVDTSGWSYDHWKDVFYPKGVKSSGYLEFYAEHFDCVELNSSFYHLPKHQTILDWKHRTPDDFVFCPKLSRLITHQKKLNDVEDAFSTFLERFQPLKEKIGPILVQFPQQVKFNNPHVEPFFKLICRFHSWRFALEARDVSWMTEEAKLLVEEKNMIWVIADSGGEYPSMEVVTSDAVYLRFHGPKATYASKYDKRTLAKYAEKANRWLLEGKEVLAFFNNDMEGFAIENAKTFKELMGG